MNEIPKNAPTGIPQQTQQPAKVDAVKTEVIQEQPTEQIVEQAPAKEINEIPDNPADRSGVKVDNLESDLKVFVDNPELAQKALDVAQLAEQRYAESGVENPELKALAVGKAFVDEFQK